MYHIVNEKHLFLYYMICWGLRFSVIQFFRITENTMFILKFVDLKHDFFLPAKRKNDFTLSSYPYIRPLK